MVGILLNTWSSDRPSQPYNYPKNQQRSLHADSISAHSGIVLVIGSLSQFTFYLFGVNELVANVVAGIKPGHKSFRLSIRTLGKRHRGAIGLSSAFGRNCLNRGIELGTVCVENLYDIPVGIIRRQDELVG